MVVSKFFAYLPPAILASLVALADVPVATASAMIETTKSVAVHSPAFTLDETQLDSINLNDSPDEPHAIGLSPSLLSQAILLSQTIPLPPSNSIPDRINEPAPLPPLPAQPLPTLPPPDELLPQPQPRPPAEEPGIPTQVFVRQFQVEGSTVFSAAELAVVTAPFEERTLSFTELLQARSAVTQLYVSRGYITSGAYIPPQTLEGGIVTIRVIEGSLEDINVTGTRRLRPSYIRSRLAIAASPPLNTNRLLEGLRLLQLNPLIDSISADLQAGARPGTSLLQIQVAEADTSSAKVDLNNGRSPSVGSFRRGIQLTEANLLGLGDGLTIGYNNTDGSNQLSGSYTLPLNPRNGTLQFSIGATRSNVIEPPFNPLDIVSNSRYYEITLRQPLYQTSTEEFALGFTAARQESKAEFSPFDTSIQPLRSLESDEEGRTRISALRFFQEWTKRSSNYVLAARSQFSLGLDLLDSTVSDSSPDSRFFAWRGQGQWVRLLAPDTLLLARVDAQLTDSALLPLEQFGLGGQDTVRGYRQDFFLADNGALFSTEIRVPLLRVPSLQGILQVVPFVDVGAGWNHDAENLDPDTIVGTGVGLLWQQGDYLTIRLDYGIPLVSVDRTDRTWQESGVYFSIVLSPL